MPLLTKSKFLSGLQCAKYLWVSFNDKAKIPPTDASTQFVFDQGHEVGELAKSFFPGGINIPYDGFRESIAATAKLLPQRKPLFETSILAGDLYSRIDILNPVGENEWDLIEVKSSTSVKEEHIADAAFQKYVCEQAGLNIRHCHLMHLNNEYVRQGALDVAALFVLADISQPVEAVSAQIPGRVNVMFGTIDLKHVPEVAIGPHCLQPYECPLKDQCWSFLPKRSIFNLYWLGREKKFELLAQGFQTIEELPDHIELSDKQRLQRQAIQDGRAHIDVQAIRAFLQTFRYPLYYLDFETFSPAIPLYHGTRAYQRIPFQFSLHVVNEDLSTEHRFFLADGASDPRPAFLRALKESIGTAGSVIVYNQKFEEGILKELAAAFPKESAWLQAVIQRMVDLLVPFQAFHYHHPDQNGSASLKNVLPVLTGQSYQELAIQDGDQASRLFVETFVKGSRREGKDTVRRDLEAYCRLDTQAMVDIVAKLREMVG